VGVATAFNWRALALRLALLLLVVLLLLASSSAAARQGENEPSTVAPEPCPVTLHTEREREPNDEAPDAQSLDGPICVTGEIVAADQDVFRWELDETAARERWTFVLSGLPGQAGVVSLFRPTFDSDGSTVTAVDEVIGAANQPGDPPDRRFRLSHRPNRRHHRVDRTTRHPGGPGRPRYLPLDRG
jgi:hypothetical protein